MRKSTGLYPMLRVDATGKRVMSHAGAVVLAATADKVGLGRGLSAELAPWRRPMAVHDPGKILLDLAVSLAIGGDCLADIAQLRAEPAVFGHVASDPTVSRLIDTLAADAVASLKAIDTARAAARARAWELAGKNAPDHDRSAKDPLVVDVDATLVTAHSEKQMAAATFKKGFGFHPIGAWVDHGPGGTGEPWRCSCGRATPDPTPPPTTSPSRGPLSRNCRVTGQAEGRAGPCWCAPMAPAAPTRSWPG